MTDKTNQGQQSLEHALTNAVETAKLSVVSTVVGQNPQITLDQLIGKHKDFGSIRVSTLLLHPNHVAESAQMETSSWEKVGTGEYICADDVRVEVKVVPQKKPHTGGPSKLPAIPEIPLNTVGQRERYLQRIMKCLAQSKKPMGSRKICEKLGGSIPQFRSITARAVASGQIIKSGLRNSTAYHTVRSHKKAK